MSLEITHKEKLTKCKLLPSPQLPAGPALHQLQPGLDFGFDPALPLQNHAPLLALHNSTQQPGKKY